MSCHWCHVQGGKKWDTVLRTYRLQACEWQTRSPCFLCLCPPLLCKHSSYERAPPIQKPQDDMLESEDRWEDDLALHFHSVVFVCFAKSDFHPYCFDFPRTVCEQQIPWIINDLDRLFPVCRRNRMSFLSPVTEETARRQWHSHHHLSRARVPPVHS